MYMLYNLLVLIKAILYITFIDNKKNIFWYLPFPACKEMYFLIKRPLRYDHVGDKNRPTFFLKKLLLWMLTLNLSYRIYLWSGNINLFILKPLLGLWWGGVYVLWMYPLCLFTMCNPRKMTLTEWQMLMRYGKPIYSNDDILQERLVFSLICMQ